MKGSIPRILPLVMIFCVAITLGSCQASSQAESDSEPAQLWQAMPPESQGMDSALLAEMFETIQQQGIRLHSLLIARSGYLVVEAYWHPYGPETKHTMESNTKSVIGALVGIAIEQGSLEGVDQRLVDFFPDRTLQDLDEEKRAITLHNLLSMTPGLNCQDLSSAGQGMFKADDWVQYLLDLPVTDPPGSRWIYCSGTAHLLSAILQNSTGMDPRTFANTFLFNPLGIPEVPVEDWSSDPGGLTNGIAGLYLTPRDLAKFGYLYLNQGNYNGQQILPAEWVAASTREQAYIGPDNYVGGLDRRFGYFWSIFPDLGYYGYLGMAGQELFVVPEKELVIVFTGALQVGQEASLLELVNEYIIPAASSPGPLPSNSQAQQRLAELIRLAAGSEQPVPSLPPGALEISGRTYLLDPNPLGWEDIALIFQPESDTAILRMTGSPDLAIGLDDRYRLTEVPDTRPVGLRGRWTANDEFELDYILLGDFIESDGSFKFEGSNLTLTIVNLNFSNPPLILQGQALE